MFSERELLKSDNTLFDDLIKNIENNADLAQMAEQLLFDDAIYPFAGSDPVINLGIRFGIFGARKGRFAISNVIFETYLYNHLIIRRMRERYRISVETNEITILKYYTEPEEVFMRIEHIAMYVSDLCGARDFFVKYFGAVSNEGYHNKKTDFKSFFLSFDGGARLEIMNKPQMTDIKKDLVQKGYIHIAFSVGSKERVDALTAQLKADGYEIVSGPRTTGDGYYESCIVGLEGNQIEITV